MYHFELLNAEDDRSWRGVASHEDLTVFQTRAWISFVAATQQAVPVIVEIRDGDRTIGHFVGLVVERLGVRILGSPFPGWTTDYMGFILEPGSCRVSALCGLFEFAFARLGCAHVELMDRCLTVEDLGHVDVKYRLYEGFAVDLSLDETTLFANFTSACRRCIRKADKDGVQVEVAPVEGFAEDYFAQLTDVFAKQGLVPTYGVDRVRQLIGHLHPAGHLLLVRARDQSGRSIATGIFPFLHAVMYFWGGASWREFQILRPNQAVHWFAMRYAKAQGVHTYDLGGAGEYKRQYGGREIRIPWVRKSKYPWMESARTLAQEVFRVRQQMQGQWRQLFAKPRAVSVSGTVDSSNNHEPATSQVYR